MIKNTIKYSAGILAAFAFIITFSQTTYAQQQLDVPQSSNSSLNWSGYVADSDTGGSGYTSVIGTWSVPSVSATTTGTADATWVGIGGVTSHDLVQAGTQAIVGDDGSIAYSAWIETLPGFSKTVPLTIESGDSVTATLTEESAGEWLITINDNTRGTSYSRTVAYDSSNSSAEWVEEMVSNGDGTFRPLDSFGIVSFTDAAATVDGTSQNLSQLDANPLKMVNAGQTVATASVIGSDNESFNVTRTDVPVAVAEPQQHVYSAYSGTMPVTITVMHRHGRSSRGYGNGYRIVGIPLNFTVIRL